MENKNDMFNKAPKNNKQKMFKFNLYWMYGLIFIMLFALYLTNDSSASKELGWTEFQKLAQENVFDRMVVYNKKNLVEATVKDGRKGLVFRKDSATLVQTRKCMSKYRRPINFQTSMTNPLPKIISLRKSASKKATTRSGIFLFRSVRSC